VTKITASNEVVISEWLIGKEWQGSGRGLILSTVPNLPGETEEHHEKFPSEYTVSELKFEPGTSRIRSRSVNHSTKTFGVKLKNAWSCNSTPSFVLKVRFLWKTLFLHFWTNTQILRNSSSTTMILYLQYAQIVHSASVNWCYLNSIYIQCRTADMSIKSIAWSVLLQDRTETCMSQAGFKAATEDSACQTWFNKQKLGDGTAVIY
jgi:hypothetical protein